MNKGAWTKHASTHGRAVFNLQAWILETPALLSLLNQYLLHVWAVAYSSTTMVIWMKQNPIHLNMWMLGLFGWNYFEKIRRCEFVGRHVSLGGGHAWCVCVCLCVLFCCVCEEQRTTFRHWLPFPGWSRVSHCFVAQCVPVWLACEFQSCSMLSASSWIWGCWNYICQTLSTYSAFRMHFGSLGLQGKCSNSLSCVAGPYMYLGLFINSSEWKL